MSNRVLRDMYAEWKQALEYEGSGKLTVDPYSLEEEGAIALVIETKKFTFTVVLSKEEVEWLSKKLAESIRGGGDE